MKNVLLAVSLGINVAMIIGYSERRKKFYELSQDFTNLGYRANSLLQQHGIEPDAIIVKMLQDLRTRQYE